AANGVWSHGSVLATKEVTKPLPLKTTDKVATAVDKDGNLDVAFTEGGALEYSQVPESGSAGEPEKIASITEAIGLSIAAAPDGTPWVAWLSGNDVQVASKAGKGWNVQSVARLAAPAEVPERTSIQVGDKGPVLAYSDPSGQGPML